MSEYQYYEFQAVDRQLSDRDMEELRALYTRAEITRTSFTNEYHWGDFKGNVEKVLEKYFVNFTDTRAIAILQDCGLAPGTVARVSSICEIQDIFDNLIRDGLLQRGESAMLCESLLSKDTTSVEANFLLGVVRDALGDHEAAASAYRKTLFLKSDHAEAMMHLAVLMDRAGEAAAATRLRDRAKRAAGGAR